MSVALWTPVTSRWGHRPTEVGVKSIPARYDTNIDHLDRDEGLRGKRAGFWFTSPLIRLVRVGRDQTGSSIRHLWFQQIQNKHERSQMGVRRPKTSPLIYIFASLMQVPVSHCPLPATGPLPPSSGSRISSVPLPPGYILRWWSSGATEKKQRSKSHLQESRGNKSNSHSTALWTELGVKPGKLPNPLSPANIPSVASPNAKDELPNRKM